MLQQTSGTSMSMYNTLNDKFLNLHVVTVMRKHKSYFCIFLPFPNTDNIQPVHWHMHVSPRFTELRIFEDNQDPVNANSDQADLPHRGALREFIQSYGVSLLNSYCLMAGEIRCINFLVPVSFEWNSRWVIFKLILVIDGSNISFVKLPSDECHSTLPMRS